jgi:uncharacterized membrane protein
MPAPLQGISKRQSDGRHGPGFDLVQSSLPSPGVLAEYERLAPGTAERIIELARKRSELLRQIEIDFDTKNIYIRVLGSSAIIVLITVASAAAFAFYGYTFIAGLSLALPILTSFIAWVIGFYFGKAAR